MGSRWLDVDRPDHLGPLLGFVGDEFAEAGQRQSEHRAAEVGDPRLQLLVGKSRLVHQARTGRSRRGRKNVAYALSNSQAGAQKSLSVINAWRSAAVNDEGQYLELAVCSDANRN